MKKIEKSHNNMKLHVHLQGIIWGFSDWSLERQLITIGNNNKIAEYVMFWFISTTIWKYKQI